MPLPCGVGHSNTIVAITAMWPKHRRQRRRCPQSVGLFGQHHYTSYYTLLFAYQRQSRGPAFKDVPGQLLAAFFVTRTLLFLLTRTLFILVTRTLLFINSHPPSLELVEPTLPFTNSYVPSPGVHLCL